MEIKNIDWNDIKKQMQSRVVIHKHDMTPEMLVDAQDLVVSGIEQNSAPTMNIENAAKYIKENMDKKFGPVWHCFIGEGFAFDVTFQTKSLLFMFYNGSLAILLFKS